ncbi:MAG: TonB-dependent receptor [Balneolaceae bacterium]|nr:MAG: TonB-dependent receptor [Balneolaceae bacterium]
MLIIVFLVTSVLSAAEARQQRQGQGQAQGQGQRMGASISGTVTAATETGTEPLPGANVTLFTVPDSTLFRGVTTGDDGSYTLTRVRPGEYHLVVSFLGYQRQSRRIVAGTEELTGQDFTLTEGGTDLDEVSVTGLAPRMEIRGDTTAFNADAYRVNRDASAEDLVRRMPGFTVEGGRVQAQGEELRRVLVDGEEFFGDDATLALRNLPAEIIQQIEVFDQLSDQALFTGFNDGNTTRTLNVVTRIGMNNGSFGRVNASYGTDERYMGSGNVNLFNGARRISFLGMSNNMNQQNFSSEDLLGVAQGAATGGRGGGMTGGRPGGPGGGRGSWGGGNNTRDFLIGQQGGISTVHSAGLNYIDRWGDKWRVSSSYFFNATGNTNNQTLERRFFSEFDSDQLYDEASLSDTDNFNHRLNGRLEYTMDDRNSMIITPRISFQQNSAVQALQGSTLAGPDLLNRTSNFYESENSGYNIAGNMLYRHRFEKRGRTFSANLRSDFNSRTGDQLQIGESFFFDEENLNLVSNQNTDILSRGQSVSTSFQITEPVSERGQIVAGYTPGISLSLSERDAYQFDEQSGTYTILDPNLTSRFDNTVITHNGSGGYRFSTQTWNYNVNLAWQYTLLKGEQTFPVAVDTRKTYQNVLPSATMMYRFSRASNLMMRYNTRTSTPSAAQLQDVINNSNPLQLTGGNPDLNQQYTHSLMARYRSANVEKGTSFISFVNVGYTLDYIGNLTFTAVRDTLIRDGIVLGRGSRLVIPDNTGNAWSARSFFSYGMPAGFIKSNVNLFSGVSYSLTPTTINGTDGNTRNIGLNGGMAVNSNISPEVDFTLSYNAGYNFVDSPENALIDNNYYTGRAGARVNVQMFGRLVLASEFSMTHYEGLDLDFDPNTYYWNASVGYKFLPDRAGELRLTVIDILGQNNSVNRIVQENYVEDVRSDVLSSYVMLTFAYNFRAYRR